jgi:hypothetical protein
VVLFEFVGVEQYRGPFGAISTALPGCQFGELMPEQARIAETLYLLQNSEDLTPSHN